MKVFFFVLLFVFSCTNQKEKFTGETCNQKDSIVFESHKILITLEQTNDTVIDGFIKYSAPRYKAYFIYNVLDIFCGVKNICNKPEFKRKIYVDVCEKNTLEFNSNLDIKEISDLLLYYSE